MASQLAAVANANANGNNNPGLNLSTNSNGSTNQSNDLPNSNGQLNEMQLAQQRFMMMMFLYNQFVQAQTQSS